MNESPITKDMLKRCLPAKVHTNLSDEFIQSLNSNIVDPNFREVYRENLLGFGSVLQEGRFKLQTYVDAVKFVSYKLLGSTDIEGYAKTFPDRYQRLVNEGADQKTISSYVSAYKNKNQIVAKVFEQTMMPTYIVNADLYQRAVNVQADLMMNARSEKVRSDAAGWIMKELKAPEATKIELDVGLKQDSTLTDLRAATQALVNMQKNQLEEGHMNAMAVANSQIVKVVEKEIE